MHALHWSGLWLRPVRVLSLLSIRTWQMVVKRTMLVGTELMKYLLGKKQHLAARQTPVMQTLQMSWRKCWRSSQGTVGCGTQLLQKKSCCHGVRQEPERFLMFTFGLYLPRKEQVMLLLL